VHDEFAILQQDFAGDDETGTEFAMWLLAGR
jgi:hypothetical protein